MRYTQRLAEAGIEPFVGSRGDSFDSLAESATGCSRPRSFDDRDRGGGSRPSNLPRSSRLSGSTPGGCSNHSAICRQPSTRRATMTRPQRPDPHQPPSHIPARFTATDAIAGDTQQSRFRPSCVRCSELDWLLQLWAWLSEEGSRDTGALIGRGFAALAGADGRSVGASGRLLLQRCQR